MAWHSIVETTKNAQHLMRNLYAQCATDVKAVTVPLSTAPNTAASLINDMVEQCVLAGATGGRRNRLFLFHDYLELFRK